MRGNRTEDILWSISAAALGGLMAVALHATLVMQGIVSAIWLAIAITYTMTRPAA